MNTDTPAAPEEERTVAFYADPRAATLLLSETIERLISSSEIKRGIVDLSTLPGLAIAAAFERAGVPFDTLSYGQTDHHDLRPAERDTVQNPYVAEDLPRLRAAAAGAQELAIDELGGIDANIVLIPAMADTGENRIDFNPLTVVGQVFEQLEAAGRDVMVVDTPDRGLRATGDGTYVRTIIHVQAQAG